MAHGIGKSDTPTSVTELNREPHVNRFYYEVGRSVSEKARASIRESYNKERGGERERERERERESGSTAIIPSVLGFFLLLPSVPPFLPPASSGLSCPEFPQVSLLCSRSKRTSDADDDDDDGGDVDGSRSRVMEAVSAPGSFTIGFAFSFLPFHLPPYVIPSDRPPLLSSSFFAQILPQDSKQCSQVW